MLVPSIARAPPPARNRTAPSANEVTVFEDREGWYRVSRSEPLPDDPSLNYSIIVNWVIAEHKSQGLFQTEYGRHSHENFWVLDSGTPSAETKAGQLFAQLTRNVHQLSKASAH